MRGFNETVLFGTTTLMWTRPYRHGSILPEQKKDSLEEVGKNMTVGQFTRMSLKNDQKHPSVSGVYYYRLNEPIEKVISIYIVIFLQSG